MSVLVLSFRTYQTQKDTCATLESIFAQTVKPYEIIVVNDGSTDDTASVLDQFVGRLIRIDQQNLGGNSARNRGFVESTGDFLVFCDADVVLIPTALQMMLTALKTHQEAAFAYSAFRFGWKRFRSFHYSAIRLRKMNYIHTTSLICRVYFQDLNDT